MLDRPDRSDLTEIATEFGFELTPAGDDALARLAEYVLEIADGLGAVDGRAVSLVRPGVRRATPSDDPLNAIVHWCDVVGESANGLLAGTRISIKDCIAIAGVPMTAGSAVLAEFVPSSHSPVVERILAQGGRVVATTNMDAFGYSAGGESSAWGPTLNPHERTRTAGGSSSGAAASLFYESIDGALGADQGGSVRTPAAWCGVIGLKPTFSLVPYVRALTLDGGFDHIGPLARTAEMLARLLQAIAGAHADDHRQRAVTSEDYLAAAMEAPEHLMGTTIGVVTEAMGVEVESETVAGVREALSELSGLGARVVDISVPELSAPLTAAVAFISYIEGTTAAFRGGGVPTGLAVPAWPELARYMRSAVAAHGSELPPQVKAALLAGAWLTKCYRGETYSVAQNSRTSVTAAVSRALDTVDFLALPAVPFRAHLRDPGVGIFDHVVRGWAGARHAVPFNVTGNPAITLPLAIVGGLPVGTMLVAPHFHDSRLISVAATVENALGWPLAEMRVATQAQPQPR